MHAQNKAVVWLAAASLYFFSRPQQEMFLDKASNYFIVKSPTTYAGAVFPGKTELNETLAVQKRPCVGADTAILLKNIS